MGQSSILHHFPIFFLLCFLFFFFNAKTFKFLNTLWDKSFATKISSPLLSPMSLSQTPTHLGLPILTDETWDRPDL